MAVNETRSLNGDLREGITDGVVKKIAPDRGGSLSNEEDAALVRASVHQDLYDPVEMANPVHDVAASRLHYRR